MAEADACKRLLRFVNPPHEVFQRVNPVDVVVSGKARASSQISVAGIKRRRKLAVANVESPQCYLRRVAVELGGEHLAVIARDVAEPFHDVITFEQADFHKVMTRALPFTNSALPIVLQVGLSPALLPASQWAMREAQWSMISEPDGLLISSVANEKTWGE